MKMAYFIKIPNNMLDNIPYLEGRIKLIGKPIPGHKDFNKVIKIGENGDDFTRNLKSIKLTFDRYKVPRIALRKFQ